MGSYTRSANGTRVQTDLLTRPCTSYKVSIRYEEEWKDLEAINRRIELLVLKDQCPALRVAAVTRSQVRARMLTKVLREEAKHRIRIERISADQDEEIWIHNLKLYLRGEWNNLSPEVAITCGKMATNYDLEVHGLLFFFLPGDI